jgi:hypothetical protein
VKSLENPPAAAERWRKKSLAPGVGAQSRNGHVQKEKKWVEKNKIKKRKEPTKL